MKRWKIIRSDGHDLTDEDFAEIIAEVDGFTDAKPRPVILGTEVVPRDTDLYFFWWDWRKREVYIDNPTAPRFHTDDGNGGHIPMRDALLQDVIDGKANIWPIKCGWYVA